MKSPSSPTASIASSFPTGFVANKSREEVNAGLVAAFLQPVPDMIAIPFTPILINTSSKFVGMDTGGRARPT